MQLSALFSRRRIAAAGAVGAAALTPVAVLAAMGAAAPPPAAVAAASVPNCTTAGLVVWLDTEGNGAAGSVYYNLELTNLSGHTCILFGYPGVSAVNLAGRQLGSAASRNAATKAATVTLANTASATAVVQIVQASNFPSASCRQSNAAGLRVYPPNQTTSKVVPFSFQSCSRSGPVYLTVEAVRKG